jgi:transposase
MAKYSFDFKRQVVQDYLDGKGGAEYLAKKYAVPAPSNIKQWIKVYKEHGDEGLMRSRKKNNIVSNSSFMW